MWAKHLYGSYFPKSSFRLSENTDYQHITTIKSIVITWLTMYKYHYLIIYCPLKSDLLDLISSKFKLPLTRCHCPFFNIIHMTKALNPPLNGSNLLLSAPQPKNEVNFRLVFYLYYINQATKIVFIYIISF